MDKRFNVHIYTEMGGLYGMVNIVFWEERLGKAYSASIDSKTGLLIFKETEEGSQPIPTLRIPYPVLHELVIEASKIGVKPEEASKTLGLLEATKFHLEDMRKIVFKGKQ